MLPVRHDAFLALDQAIMRLEQGWYTPHGDDDVGFDHHPLPMGEFLAGMTVAGEAFPHQRAFLDLGCGMGTKLLVAYLLGWDVTGVERHPDYARAAVRLVPEAQVVVGDVRRPPVDLASFDVVYAYGPLRDLFDAMPTLAADWVRRMRPGALLFAAGFDPVGLAPVGPGVWRV